MARREITSARSDAVLVVEGDVDCAWDGELDVLIAAFLSAGGRDLRLDLRAVTFIDAAALGLLAATSARLRSTGGSVTVTEASALVRRRCALARLDDLLAPAPAA